MRRRSVVALLVVGCLLLAQAAWALVSPVVVLDPPASQFSPFRNATYLIYASDSKATPRHTDAFARTLVGGITTKINAKGNGYPGGFDPGTDTLIFQQWTKSASDIYLYDLDTASRVPSPHALHTSKVEFDPHISTAYISFFRYVKVNGVWYGRLFLYDRVAQTLSKITDIRYNSKGYFTNDFLGEHYASWTVCGKTCVVRVRNLDTDTTSVLPSPNGKPQYTSTIDETAGVLFYGRSGFGCGLKVGFWTVTVADLTATPTKIAALPDGRDIGSTASLSNGDLLFSMYKCGGWSGIFALPGVDT
jgi:hypothetical protein